MAAVPIGGQTNIRFNLNWGLGAKGLWLNRSLANVMSAVAIRPFCLGIDDKRVILIGYIFIVRVLERLDKTKFHPV